LPKSREELQKELAELQQESERQALEKQVSDLKNKVHPSKSRRLFGGVLDVTKAVAKQVQSDMDGSWDKSAQKKSKKKGVAE